MLHNIAAEQHIIHKHIWIFKLNTTVSSKSQITEYLNNSKNTKSNKQHAMTILDQSPNLDTCMKKRNSTPRHQQANN